MGSCAGMWPVDWLGKLGYNIVSGLTAWESCDSQVFSMAVAPRLRQLCGWLEACRGSSEVEQWTENPRVVGSIPTLGTKAGECMSGSGSVVEHLLAKERVVGSNPIFRSILFNYPNVVSV